MPRPASREAAEGPGRGRSRTPHVCAPFLSPMDSGLMTPGGLFRCGVNDPHDRAQASGTARPELRQLGRLSVQAGRHDRQSFQSASLRAWKIKKRSRLAERSCERSFDQRVGPDVAGYSGLFEICVECTTGPIQRRAGVDLIRSQWRFAARARDRRHRSRTPRSPPHCVSPAPLRATGRRPRSARRRSCPQTPGEASPTLGLAKAMSG